MPKASEFVLKDSPKELIDAAGVEPRGRTYDGEIAKRPGAAHVDEILLGTKLACVSITDDEEGTLAKVSKANPWHNEAMAKITGSQEEANRPLTEILTDHFDLKLDHHIDVHKFAGMAAVDTQGFVAHNDDIVVVSFRCTTSAYDWMTNFHVASSEWELDVDLPLGHSGYCSCLMGRFCVKGEKKPRVHSGFYNNILQVIPILEEYVKPLLGEDQPPRTLYIVGHSLGAGISTLAACYFLLSYDWEKLPHRLLNISAGTPRACKGSMADLVNEKLDVLSPMGKAGIFRVVMNEDIVCKVPSERQGYEHIGKLVFLTEDGEVLVGPKVSDSHTVDEKEMKKMKENDPALVAALEANEKEKEQKELGFRESVHHSMHHAKESIKRDYDKLVAKIPRPFRDHCPDCYLEPLLRLYEREHESQMKKC